MSSRKAARPRSPPFSDLEIAILMSCLDQWKSIVESNETDAWSVQTKKEAWEQIADEYEETCLKHGIFTPRTVDQLKACWKNSEAKVRKIDSEIKTQAILTGGGPEHEVSDADNSLSAMAHSIKPTLDFTLENKWDSTGAFEGTVDLTKNESNKNDSTFNDEDISMENESDDDVEAPCSQIMAKKKSDREALKQNLLNEMNERKQALAKLKGFCKPANASFKIKQFTNQSVTSKIVRTGGTVETKNCATTAILNDDQSATRKMTTTQKLGQRMRNWEASLACGDNERDVKPSTSTDTSSSEATSSGILESRMKKCQGNVDPRDGELFPKRGKGMMTAAHAEQMERVERAEERRAQQAEFHRERMEILQLEKAFWGIRIETASIEKNKAASSASKSPTTDSDL